MDIEFEEFKKIINEPISDEPKQRTATEVFLFFCFMQIFKTEPENDATVILAAMAAHSFCRSNFVEGTRIANKSIAIRHHRKSLKAMPRKGFAMKM